MMLRKWNCLFVGFQQLIFQDMIQEVSAGETDPNLAVSSPERVATEQLSQETHEKSPFVRRWSEMDQYLICNGIKEYEESQPPGSWKIFYMTQDGTGAKIEIASPRHFLKEPSLVGFEPGSSWDLIRHQFPFGVVGINLDGFRESVPFESTYKKQWALPIGLMVSKVTPVSISQSTGDVHSKPRKVESGLETKKNEVSDEVSLCTKDPLVCCLRVIKKTNMNSSFLATQWKTLTQEKQHEKSRDDKNYQYYYECKPLPVVPFSGRSKDPDIFERARISINDCGDKLGVDPHDREGNKKSILSKKKDIPVKDGIIVKIEQLLDMNDPGYKLLRYLDQLTNANIRNNLLKRGGWEDNEDSQLSVSSPGVSKVKNLPNLGIFFLSVAEWKEKSEGSLPAPDDDASSLILKKVQEASRIAESDLSKQFVGDKYMDKLQQGFDNIEKVAQLSIPWNAIDSKFQAYSLSSPQSSSQPEDILLKHKMHPTEFRPLVRDLAFEKVLNLIELLIFRLGESKSLNRWVVQYKKLEGVLEWSKINKKQELIQSYRDIKEKRCSEQDWFDDLHRKDLIVKETWEKQMKQLTENITTTDANKKVEKEPNTAENELRKSIQLPDSLSDDDQNNKDLYLKKCHNIVSLRINDAYSEPRDKDEIVTVLVKKLLNFAWQSINSQAQSMQSKKQKYIDFLRNRITWLRLAIEMLTAWRMVSLPVNMVQQSSVDSLFQKTFSPTEIHTGFSKWFELVKKMYLEVEEGIQEKTKISVRALEDSYGGVLGQYRNLKSVVMKQLKNTAEVESGTPQDQKVKNTSAVIAIDEPAQERSLSAEIGEDHEVRFAQHSITEAIILPWMTRVNNSLRVLVDVYKSMHDVEKTDIAEENRKNEDTNTKPGEAVSSFAQALAKLFLTSGYKTWKQPGDEQALSDPQKRINPSDDVANEDSWQKSAEQDEGRKAEYERIDTYALDKYWKKLYEKETKTANNSASNNDNKTEVTRSVLLTKESYIVSANLNMFFRLEGPLKTELRTIILDLDAIQQWNFYNWWLARFEKVQKSKVVSQEAIGKLLYEKNIKRFDSIVNTENFSEAAAKEVAQLGLRDRNIIENDEKFRETWEKLYYYEFVAREGIKNGEPDKTKLETQTQHLQNLVKDSDSKDKKRAFIAEVSVYITVRWRITCIFPFSFFKSKAYNNLESEKKKPEYEKNSDLKREIQSKERYNAGARHEIGETAKGTTPYTAFIEEWFGQAKDIWLKLVGNATEQADRKKVFRESILKEDVETLRQTTEHCTKVFMEVFKGTDAGDPEKDLVEKIIKSWLGRMQDSLTRLVEVHNGFIELKQLQNPLNLQDRKLVLIKVVTSLSAIFLGNEYETDAEYREKNKRIGEVPNYKLLNLKERWSEIWEQKIEGRGNNGESCSSEEVNQMLLATLWVEFKPVSKKESRDTNTDQKNPVVERLNEYFDIKSGTFKTDELKEVTYSKNPGRKFFGTFRLKLEYLAKNLRFLAEQNSTETSALISLKYEKCKRIVDSLHNTMKVIFENNGENMIGESGWLELVDRVFALQVGYHIQFRWSNFVATISQVLVDDVRRQMELYSGDASATTVFTAFKDWFDEVRRIRKAIQVKKDTHFKYNIQNIRLTLAQARYTADIHEREENVGHDVTEKVGVGSSDENIGRVFLALDKKKKLEKAVQENGQRLLDNSKSHGSRTVFIKSEHRVLSSVVLPWVEKVQTSITNLAQIHLNLTWLHRHYDSILVGSICPDGVFGCGTAPTALEQRRDQILGELVLRVEDFFRSKEYQYFESNADDGLCTTFAKAKITISAPEDAKHAVQEGNQDECKFLIDGMLLKERLKSVWSNNDNYEILISCDNEPTQENTSIDNRFPSWKREHCEAVKKIEKFFTTVVLPKKQGYEWWKYKAAIFARDAVRLTIRYKTYLLVAFASGALVFRGDKIKHLIEQIHKMTDIVGQESEDTEEEEEEEASGEKRKGKFLGGHMRRDKNRYKDGLKLRTNGGGDSTVGLRGSNTAEMKGSAAQLHQNKSDPEIVTTIVIVCITTTGVLLVLMGILVGILCWQQKGNKQTLHSAADDFESLMRTQSNASGAHGSFASRKDGVPGKPILKKWTAYGANAYEVNLDHIAETIGANAYGGLGHLHGKDAKDGDTKNGDTTTTTGDDSIGDDGTKQDVLKDPATAAKVAAIVAAAAEASKKEHGKRIVFAPDSEHLYEEESACSTDEEDQLIAIRAKQGSFDEDDIDKLAQLIGSQFELNSQTDFTIPIDIAQSIKGLNDDSASGSIHGDLTLEEQFASPHNEGEFIVGDHGEFIVGEEPGVDEKGTPLWEPTKISRFNKKIFNIDKFKKSEKAKEQQSGRQSVRQSLTQRQSMTGGRKSMTGDGGRQSQGAPKSQQGFVADEAMPSGTMMEWGTGRKSLGGRERPGRRSRRSIGRKSRQSMQSRKSEMQSGYYDDMKSERATEIETEIVEIVSEMDVGAKSVFEYSQLGAKSGTELKSEGMIELKSKGIVGDFKSGHCDGEGRKSRKSRKSLRERKSTRKSFKSQGPRSDFGGFDDAIGDVKDALLFKSPMAITKSGPLAMAAGLSQTVSVAKAPQVAISFPEAADRDSRTSVEERASARQSARASGRQSKPPDADKKRIESKPSTDVDKKGDKKDDISDVKETEGAITDEVKKRSVTTEDDEEMEEYDEEEEDDLEDLFTIYEEGESELTESWFDN